MARACRRRGAVSSSDDRVRTKVEGCEVWKKVVECPPRSVAVGFQYNVQADALRGLSLTCVPIASDSLSAPLAPKSKAPAGDLLKP